MRGEHERIRWLRARARTSDAVPLGIGDDAAVVHAPGGAVVSVDAQVEGVHFRPDFADWHTLGRRATIAALSDLAAMGADARAVISSQVLPASFDAFEALADGIADAAAECGAVVAGGNLARGPVVMLDTTVIGAAPGGVVSRHGASAGDTLYVRGYPGAAALGLAALLQGKAPLAPTFVDAWRRPTLDFDFARQLSSLATAAIDLSDGLGADLRHLCTGNDGVLRLGARLDLAAIPQMEGFVDTCARLDASPQELLISGGEVYELLFASRDPNLANRFPVHPIGELTDDGLIADIDGVALSASGFDHFLAE